MKLSRVAFLAAGTGRDWRDSNEDDSILLARRFNQRRGARNEAPLLSEGVE